MGRHGRMFGMGAAPLDQEQRPINPATVRRVVGTFRPYRRKVAVVGIMIVITAGLGVVNPLLIVRVFDQALFAPNNDCSGQPCPNLPLLYFYVALMILIPLVTSIVGVGQTYL